MCVPIRRTMSRPTTKGRQWCVGGMKLNPRPRLCRPIGGEGVETAGPDGSLATVRVII